MLIFNSVELNWLNIALCFLETGSSCRCNWVISLIDSTQTSILLSLVSNCFLGFYFDEMCILVLFSPQRRCWAVRRNDGTDQTLGYYRLSRARFRTYFHSVTWFYLTFSCRFRRKFTNDLTQNKSYRFRRKKRSLLVSRKETELRVQLTVFLIRISRK